MATIINKRKGIKYKTKKKDLYQIKMDELYKKVLKEKELKKENCK